MQYSLLNDVTAEHHHWTVRARAVRFSEYKSNDNPPRILRIDLVLLDEKGKSMEAQILEHWIPIFKPQLQEEHVYYIKDFQVVNARGQYRPVDHAYRARFTGHTRLYEINPAPPEFPMYSHAAAPYEVLNARIGITEFTSDAIGVFMGCSHVKTQNTRGGPKPLRNIYITDGRETAVVTLWNDHAEIFDADRYMEMAYHQPVVFLFVGVTCRTYEGKLSLQGSTLCKWYVNPKLPEAIALHDSSVGRLPAPVWYGPGPGQTDIERVSIAQLAAFTNPHVIYNNRYITTAKIRSIVRDQSWWYLACDECNRTIQPHGTGSPRYRLPLIVVDPHAPTQGSNAPSVELVLFGPIAQELIGVDVQALIASQAGMGAFLPTRITSLYGKCYNLRLSVSPGCLQRTTITYQVDSVLGVADALPAPAPQYTHTGPASTEQAPVLSIESSAQAPGTSEPPGNEHALAVPTTGLDITPTSKKNDFPSVPHEENTDTPTEAIQPTIDKGASKCPANMADDTEPVEVSGTSRPAKRRLVLDDAPTDA